MATKRWLLIGLVLWSAACASGSPISGAKFVKTSQERPAGNVTMSVASALSIPASESDSGEAAVFANTDSTLVGFGGEGYMARYGDMYDWSVGVSSGGGLFFDANVTVLDEGTTRLGVLHGVGLSLSYVKEGSQSAFGGELSPTAGVFFQHSTSPLSHLYGTVRATYALGFSNGDGASDNELTLLGSVGYSLMDGQGGLTLTPELFVGQQLEEATFIGLSLSMSAYFL